MNDITMNGPVNYTNLGIIEFRNVVAAILEAHDVDYSNYSFTAFCRRIEYVIANNNLASSAELVLRLKTDKEFIKTFLEEIAIEETEMFRDPGLWRELRDNYLPKTNLSSYRIWMPGCTSGEELYTLLIILKEMGILNQIKVIASTHSDINIEKLKRGIYSMKKMEVNDANYVRYKGDFQLSNYYREVANDAVMDKQLHSNVEFNLFDFQRDKVPTKIDLILYRNRVVYFNKKMHCDIIGQLHDSLVPGGKLVLGIKESMEGCNPEKKFILVNEAESIYKKAIV